MNSPDTIGNEIQEHMTTMTPLRMREYLQLAVTLLVMGIIAMNSVRIVAWITAIPLLILAIGIVMLYKHREFKPVATAALVCHWFLVAVMVLAGLALSARLVFFSMADLGGISTTGYAIIVGLAFGYLLLCQFFYLAPLQRHAQWVAVHGLLPPGTAKQSVAAPAGISAAAPMDGQSIGEALQQWTDLKAAGYITQEEFDTARKALLNGLKPVL
jgi:predicted ABC-type exoprotein transport system permease subunit